MRFSSASTAIAVLFEDLQLVEPRRPAPPTQQHLSAGEQRGAAGQEFLLLGFAARRRLDAAGQRGAHQRPLRRGPAESSPAGKIAIVSARADTARAEIEQGQVEQAMQRPQPEHRSAAQQREAGPDERESAVDEIAPLPSTTTRVSSSSSALTPIGVPASRSSVRPTAKSAARRQQVGPIDRPMIGRHQGEDRGQRSIARDLQRQHGNHRRRAASSPPAAAAPRPLLTRGSAGMLKTLSVIGSAHGRVVGVGLRAGWCRARIGRGCGRTRDSP